MGLRGVLSTVSNDPIQRLAGAVSSLAGEVTRLRSEVRRDCLKARGYELERRAAGGWGPAGLYLVNKISTDPNFGTATFLGP